ncbi:hypothetical protein NIES970_06540 [[Synechococcus] sp. NIES-970]|nr:hypothetical protein NIES970_06540 [[Synechococcus] sp. NIES-970]
MAKSIRFSRQDYSLLGIWVGLGALLRFSNLTFKSVWSDEWATLVFSLGHSFREIPLDQLLSLGQLLEPLRYEGTTNLADVSQLLLAESNHPPLYYWLTHLWFNLWSQEGEFISIAVGRSPAAFFGVLLIPLTFGVSYWVIKDKWVAHSGAIAMALSPYAVYLSQEARHYTLAMIWITLSYGCLAKVIQAQQQSRQAPLWVYGCWFIVNSLGIASHYFMVITLFAEGLVLCLFYGHEVIQKWRKKASLKSFFLPHWQRTLVWAIASILLTMFLLNHWQSSNNVELTTWLNRDYGWGVKNFVPPLRSIAYTLGMIFILPVEVEQTWLVVVSVIAILGILIFLVPQIIIALKQNWAQLEVKIFTYIILANLLTILGIIYISKRDISLAPRYYFIYFPALMILLGVLFKYLWQQVPDPRKIWFLRQRPSTLMIIFLMALSSWFVNVDLAYHKPQNNQAIAQILQENLNWNYPQIFVTHYFELGVVRTQMGLAWALHQRDANLRPQFLILDNFFKQNSADQVLATTLTDLSEPTQVVMLNTHFAPPEPLCTLQPEADDQQVIGYSYRLYLCLPQGEAAP